MRRFFFKYLLLKKAVCTIFDNFHIHFLVWCFFDPFLFMWLFLFLLGYKRNNWLSKFTCFSSYFLLKLVETSHHVRCDWKKSLLQKFPWQLFSFVKIIEKVHYLRLFDWETQYSYLYIMHLNGKEGKNLIKCWIKESIEYLK